MPETVDSEDRLSEALKALASPQRRALLKLVASGGDPGSCCSDDEDVCACDLAGALDLAPSTISHHMSALARAGLVTATRKGLWVHYRVEREALADVAKAIAGL